MEEKNEVMNEYGEDEKVLSKNMRKNVSKKRQERGGYEAWVKGEVMCVI